MSNPFYAFYEKPINVTVVLDLKCHVYQIGQEKWKAISYEHELTNSDTSPELALVGLENLISQKIKKDLEKQI